MRTIKSRIFVLAVLSVTVIGFMSCMRGGTMTSITVTPTNPTIAIGTTQQLTATATFSDGTTLNWTSAVTWNSSDVTIVTISNTAGSNGLATSLASGTTGTVTITATDTANNISGTATLYVTAPQSIAVTPANPYMAISTTHQFTATAIFSGGTPTNAITQNLTTFATWTSSSAGVATISDTVGSKGLVTAGTTTGKTDITASDLTSGVSGTTTLTVTAMPLLSITVTPPTPSILVGQPPQQFTSTGNYADITTPTRDFTSSVTWHSSNTGVATIDNTGLATAVAVGTVTITATDPITNISGSITLTVQ